jgi:SnoaL-like protein
MSQLSAEDRVAIGEVLASYCYAIDLGRWETLPQLFTDDCRLDFGATMGVHEGRDGLRAFTDSLRGAPIRMRHYLTNVVVTGDGERARAESYVLAFVGDPGQLRQTTGRYEDELVKRGGRWAIRVRRAVIELPPT